MVQRTNRDIARRAGRLAAAALLALSSAAAGSSVAVAQEGHPKIAEEDLAPDDKGLANKPAPDAAWDGTPGNQPPAREESEQTEAKGGAAGKVEHSMGEAGEKTRGGVEKAGEATGKALDKAIEKTGEGVGYVVDKTGQGLRKAGEALSGDK